ncbi:hypothetical protein, partial [Lysobacter sp. A3-1-A15]
RAVPADDAPQSRPPWPRSVWALPAACLLALGLTYWPPAENWLVGQLQPLDAGEVRVGMLPHEPPRARYDDTSGLLAHRDYELLGDPDGLAAARDVAFLSWLSAQDAPDVPTEVAPMPDAATDGMDGSPAAIPLATESARAPR